MAKSGIPPIPPAARSPMGGSNNPSKSGDMSSEVARANKDGQRNLGEQGRQGNSKQNTTHKGYQQDR